ncbi:hypothetical protein Nepgr_033244 [Nepenthes gracilis]|uniref:Transducin/WD40 repeat-like superfamily protein n=1 Tax=Nepenthes gracilis TaxID=150966 RepID=A0AAD3TLQ9_NEPGR|nr:hypothetical protein Nepgr_033244 [Nepenthes gracilis]
MRKEIGKNIAESKDAPTSDSSKRSEIKACIVAEHVRFWFFGFEHFLVSSNPSVSQISGEMQHFLNNDIEYVIDDYYDMINFDGEPFSEGSPPKRSIDDPFDSDLEDDFDMGKSKTDTSAVEARNGKDMQGIPWERLNFTRAMYREARLKQYKNYENLSSYHEELEKECKQVDKGNNYYSFQFNTRLVKSTIGHFQLRNLLWATSKHDVYLMQNHSIMHWSALRKWSKEVLNLAKPIVPTLKCPGSEPRPLSRVQISTMSVKDNLLVAGGFHGELICKYLNQAGVSFGTKLTTEENAITNAVDIFTSPGGSKRIMSANNDAKVRVFDAVNFASLNTFSFPWAVNSTSVSPDGKLVAVLGDSAECLVADAQSGKVAGTLRGHLDYSSASAWHPDGRVLATGNQDTTCRLWDMRNMSRSLTLLKGRMGAIRALKFTSDGRFMAMAEAADFVHIIDTESGYENGQEIDLFGEIGGISFSPDTEAFFVGVADRTYGCCLEFNRRRHHEGYLEALF